MQKRFDVIALGEVLIDFTESGRSTAGLRLFEQNPGGAVANVVCAVARFGGKAAFIGKVGCDMHGRFLRDTIAEAGVDISGMAMSEDVFTTMAFVALSETGERSFSFARKPGADTCLAISEVKIDLLENTAVFHVGSLSMTDEPARSATLYAIKKAKASGAVISYDPNYRSSLWSGENAAMEQMRAVLPFVDIIKISDNETKLLTDRESPEDAAKELLSIGIPCVAVTLGKEGALVAVKDGMRRIPTYESKVIDTTGAGDSFWGAFLWQLRQSGKQPVELNIKDVSGFASFGNAAATLCVAKRGAIPAMPSLAEVTDLMRKY